MAGNHTRYVSAGKEGTYNSAAALDAIGEVESESFQQSYDILKRADMNYYGAAKAITSKIYAEGSISMALQPCRFTLLMLHGIMGNDNPDGSAGTTGARTFTEMGNGSSTQLPSYTFRVGRDDFEHIFPGQVVDSISVSASVGEYSMMTVNTVGAKQTSSTQALATGVPAYTGDAAHFAKSFVNFDEAATSTSGGFSNLVQSIDFEIKTGRDMDNSYGLANETCIRAPPQTMREISGSMTLHKALLTGEATEGEPFFNELMPGTANVVNGSNSTPALSVLFHVDANNYIRFDFAKLIYEMPETSVSGRDTQTMTVNFHALYDVASADTMLTIACKSSVGLANYDA
tara:strand:- start:17676 stop:18710 length:1035 start_codon:yes stop_codon:yes gene_type:complete